MDFSTALNLHFVSYCLPESKVNPPQTVTAMLALRARAHACAPVPCQSQPLPNVPGPTKRNMLGHGTVHSHYSNKLDFGLKLAQAQYGLPGVNVPSDHLNYNMLKGLPGDFYLMTPEINCRPQL